MTTNEEAVALLNAALTHGGSGAMRERALHDAAIAARSALLAAAPDHQAEAPSEVEAARQRVLLFLDGHSPYLNERTDTEAAELWESDLRTLADHPVMDDAPPRVGYVVQPRKAGKTQKILESFLALAEARGLQVEIIEPKPVVDDAAARIDAALAVMDRSTYGDPEVPFRMRAALLGTEGGDARRAERRAAAEALRDLGRETEGGAQ